MKNIIITCKITGGILLKVINKQICINFRAERLGCINSKWPDLYGHYREAKFTQTKHHWWWKANRIFNELRATMYYNGEYPDLVNVNEITYIKQ